MRNWNLFFLVWETLLFLWRIGNSSPKRVLFFDLYNQQWLVGNLFIQQNIRTMNGMEIQWMTEFVWKWIITTQSLPVVHPYINGTHCAFSTFQIIYLRLYFIERVNNNYYCSDWTECRFKIRFAIDSNYRWLVWIWSYIVRPLKVDASYDADRRSLGI